ncbi:MAG TPA: hypothetical protein PKE00_01810 [Planctomycetota bacterium]|nr:hypothetical protein [Planctomycetota bacterium]
MEDPLASRPLQRSYSRIERERRFELSELPATVDRTRFERLRDCYISGTTLRIRRVESPDGTVRVIKLGQKVADPEAPDDARRRRMTTLYLDPSEEVALACLRGRRSVKRRYYHVEGSRIYAIDVYEEPVSAVGRMLAEVECDSDEDLAAVAVPAWALREVTDDPAWSGAVIASE